MKRLLRDRRGGVLATFGAALPVLMGCAMVAVDLGSVQLETRRLQGIADAAALAAAADPGNATAAARRAVALADFPHAVESVVTTGHYRRDPAVAVADRFGTAGATNAARVVLTARSPSFFARAFGRGPVTIARAATAMRADMASFSIGSRLASVDDGLLNAYLGALTGSEIRLNAADYRALAATDIDLLQFSRVLGTKAGLEAASFDRVLATEVAGATALEAVADAVPAGGAAASAALRHLSARAGNRRRPLELLIDPGALGAQDRGGSAMLHADALTLATMLLQLASSERQVRLDLPATLPGAASTRLSIAIGEREGQSPWITATDRGDPVVHTAQARIYAETVVPGVALPGVGAPAALRLPVFVEMASAEARLGAITCNSTMRGATIEARTSPASAAIADLDPARLSDFSTPPALRPARIVDTLLLDVRGFARLDAGSVEPWQSLRFDHADIAARRVRSVSASTPVRSVAASLASNVTLDVRVAGILPISATPVARTVADTLATLAPGLDTLLNVVTGTVGVRYGEADVRLTGLRCGQPVLVA